MIFYLAFVVEGRDKLLVAFEVRPLTLSSILDHSPAPPPGLPTEPELCLYTFPFQNLLPRFEVIKEVYRGTRTLIYNEPE